MPETNEEINIFVRRSDFVIFGIALAFVLVVGGYRLEQYIRSEQVASFIRAGYTLDQAKAENEQLQLETKKLEAMRPVVESIYGYKNAIANSEEGSSDG